MNVVSPPRSLSVRGVKRINVCRIGHWAGLNSNESLSQVSLLQRNRLILSVKFKQIRPISAISPAARQNDSEFRAKNYFDCLGSGDTSESHSQTHTGCDKSRDPKRRKRSRFGYFFGRSQNNGARPGHAALPADNQPTPTETIPLTCDGCRCFWFWPRVWPSSVLLPSTKRR